MFQLYFHILLLNHYTRQRSKDQLFITVVPDYHWKGKDHLIRVLKNLCCINDHFFVCLTGLDWSMMSLSSPDCWSRIAHWKTTGGEHLLFCSCSVGYLRFFSSRWDVTKYFSVYCNLQLCPTNLILSGGKRERSYFNNPLCPLSWSGHHTLHSLSRITHCCHPLSAHSSNVESSQKCLSHHYLRVSNVKSGQTGASLFSNSSTLPCSIIGFQYCLISFCWMLEC